MVERGILPEGTGALRHQPAAGRGGHAAGPRAALGRRSTTTRSGSSRGSPRSTPGSRSTPTPRSAGSSTTSRRPASSRTRSSCTAPTTAPPARAARTARSTRTSSSTPTPTTSREPRDARQARLPGHLQPLPDRVGDGVLDAVQDVQALHLPGRRRRPAGHLVAEGHQGPGEVRTQYHHAVDIVPTILECVGLEFPEEVQGYAQTELPGVSMKYTFDADGPTEKMIQYYEMFGTRALWHDGWHVVAQRAPQQGGDGGRLRQRDLGALPLRGGPGRGCTTWPPSTPRRSRSWSTSGTSRPASTTCCRSTTARSRTSSG